VKSSDFTKGAGSPNFHSLFSNGSQREQLDAFVIDLSPLPASTPRQANQKE
jgi:hypothetical protein